MKRTNKKHLNNKGYMLVEIILASVLAMGVAYFIMDLTIKLKNKNDDLLVKTLVYTDQAIIYNTIAEDLYTDPTDFNCDDVINSIDGNKFTYKNFTNIISEYATVGTPECSNTGTDVEINIPITVKQLPDDNFDVKLNYRYTVTKAYAIYFDSTNSLEFFRTNAIISAGDTYTGKKVTKVYTGFDEAVYSNTSPPPWYENRQNIYMVSVQNTIKPKSTAFWFKDLVNCNKMYLENLKTDNVTNMSSMFENAGNNVTSFTLVGLGDWNVSNVTSMDSMFCAAGQEASNWEIGDLSHWDTLKVTDMDRMFNSVGRNDTTFKLQGLSGLEVDNVTTMSNMFNGIGYSDADFKDIGIEDLHNWNVSNVTNMEAMFAWAGLESKDVNINLTGWDTSKVTNMKWMFQKAGEYASGTFTLEGLSKWNTSNVTNMNGMFEYAGAKATSWNVGDLSTRIENGNIYWDTSNVTVMQFMFRNTGYEASSFNVGNIGNWNTSNVTDMYYMFHQAWYKAAYTLDLSTKTVSLADGTTYVAWNVDKVTDHTDFSYAVTEKIKSPWD